MTTTKLYNQVHFMHGSSQCPQPNLQLILCNVIKSCTKQQLQCLVHQIIHHIHLTDSQLAKYSLWLSPWINRNEVRNELSVLKSHHWQHIVGYTRWHDTQHLMWTNRHYYLALMAPNVSRHIFDGPVLTVSQSFWNRVFDDELPVDKWRHFRPKCIKFIDYKEDRLPSTEQIEMVNKHNNDIKQVIVDLSTSANVDEVFEYWDLTTLFDNLIQIQLINRAVLPPMNAFPKLQNAIIKNGGFSLTMRQLCSIPGSIENLQLKNCHFTITNSEEARQFFTACTRVYLQDTKVKIVKGINCYDFNVIKHCLMRGNVMCIKQNLKAFQVAGVVSSFDELFVQQHRAREYDSCDWILNMKPFELEYVDEWSITVKNGFEYGAVINQLLYLSENNNCRKAVQLPPFIIIKLESNYINDGLQTNIRAGRFFQRHIKHGELQSELWYNIMKDELPIYLRKAAWWLKQVHERPINKQGLIVKFMCEM